jgi:hypothetical protein
MTRASIVRRAVFGLGLTFLGLAFAAADEKPGAAPSTGPAKGGDPAPQQEALDAAFRKMLSNATLEGSFTSTGEGADPDKLSHDKYTLGEVKKAEGNYWIIPARVQYGERDFTIPLLVPVRWAGDTPVIVVDKLGLPGFGTVSARVMFFADHYAGYWQHGKQGGTMFGVIRHEAKKGAAGDAKRGRP